jgi:alkylhydroperoxidase family enzyme
MSPSPPRSSILESGFREDLVNAHRGVIESLAEPGTWWDAAQCVAIASEVRRALAHADLPPWAAPSVQEGMIADDHLLAAAAIDAIWRITNHPGTLTQEWHEELVGAMPSPEHYVELVGIVATVNAVDRFAEILDLDPAPLPQPQPGQPTGERVSGASVSTHWVPTVDAGGPNVLSALSAVPSVLDQRNRLSAAQYVPADALLDDLEWSRGTLDRRQIELIAAQTALMNECFY